MKERITVTLRHRLTHRSAPSPLPWVHLVFSPLGPMAACWPDPTRTPHITPYTYMGGTHVHETHPSVRDRNRAHAPCTQLLCGQMQMCWHLQICCMPCSCEALRSPAQREKSSRRSRRCAHIAQTPWLAPTRDAPRIAQIQQDDRHSFPRSSTWALVWFGLVLL